MSYLQWVERTYGDQPPADVEHKKFRTHDNINNLFQMRGIFLAKAPSTDRRDYICWSHVAIKHFLIYDGRLRIQNKNIPETDQVVRGSETEGV